MRRTRILLVVTLLVVLGASPAGTTSTLTDTERVTGDVTASDEDLSNTPRTPTPASNTSTESTTPTPVTAGNESYDPP